MTGTHPLIIAHRGASASAPGNTLQAYTLAVHQDADGIEIDVRRTADGALVLCHDPTLPDGTVLVETSLEVIRERGPHVPTLDEVLLVSGDLLLDIEIKNVPGEPDHDPEAGVVTEVVRWIAMNRLHRRVMVTSFDPVATEAVRRLDVSVPTGLLVAKGTPLGAFVAPAAAVGHQGLAPHASLLDADAVGVVAAAHEAGMKVAVWTVDDPDRMRTLTAAGVDALITNDPALAVATLS